MQNKGLVKLFAVLFGLVSLYQLSFTFSANSVEKEAQEVAISKIAESEPDYRTLRSLEEAKFLQACSLAP